MTREARLLERLARGPATLADLRAALPEDDAERRAVPSMGEADPFGVLVARLVAAGRIVDVDGRYALPPGARPGPP